MAAAPAASVVKVESGRQSATVELCFAPADSLVAALPASDAPAIRGTGAGDVPLTHNELRRFLVSFTSFARWGIGATDVVAVLMPNGPELAVALLAVMAHCIAAPLEPTLGEAELRDAFQQMKVSHALILRQHRPTNLSLTNACKACSVKLCEVAPSGTRAGLFVDPDGQWNPNVVDAGPTDPGERTSTDTCLLLRTSGTTSKPKVVPLNLRGLHAGAKSIGLGLGLVEADVCINVMPYTHIGGISCSLLATLFTGGSVICAPSFNVELFVGWLGAFKPTWYYAVPTIHKAVLLHCAGVPPDHGVRIVRSGAAALPDADAQALRQLFGCAVLPTYSMSECMPVAQPPAGYALERPGSVGKPLASSLCIAGDDGEPLPFGTEGQVCVRGPVVTAGYLDNDEANSESFFGQPGADGCRWFRTGDVGRLDRDGFLTLSGRSKELIKRGGEQVSPYEVEELLAKHPAVEVALVFGVPNEFWGEEVAAAVVVSSQALAGVGADAPERVPSKVELPKQTHADKTLVGPPVQVGSLPQELANFLTQQGLPASKAPRQFVVLANAEGLPKTRTGKYMRSGLAEHLNLAAVDTQAASLLQGKQGVQLGDASRGEAVRPDKSVVGLRFFLALWVIFMHVGDFPQVISVWRLGSLSMMGFFVLAGFQLSAGVTRPIEDKREFYKNRIVAAHPLYMLALLVTVPLFFFDAGAPDSPGSATMGFFMAFFYQLAWPWGLAVSLETWMHFNGPLWFSSAYIFCILLFPLMHRALHTRWFFRCCCASRKPLDSCCCGDACPVYCCWPVCGCLSIIGAVNSTFFGVSMTLAGMAMEAEGALEGEKAEEPSMAAIVLALGGYTFPPVWAGIFFLGCLLWQLFEMGGHSAEGRWRHWGKVADGLSCYFVLSIPVLFSCMPDLALVLGPVFSRPTRGYLGLVLLHLYALATGQGCVARLLRSKLLVKYLAPASYAMYLFHFPVAHYLVLLTGEGHHDMPFGPTWMFFLVAIITTLMAVVAQHFLNGPLTSWFLRAVELCGCCGNRRAELRDDEDTLTRVISAIHSLSGQDVDGTTDLGDCGLDSFGTAALLGVLRARIPGLSLSALQIYQVGTVGELAAKIDQQMCRTPVGPTSAKEAWESP